jgi:hypothetical protein
MTKRRRKLFSKSSAVSVAFGTLSFFMADEERTVRVDIRKELLASLEGPLPRSPSDYLVCLAQRRHELEEIARVKYGEGRYGYEVNMMVVSITEEDLPVSTG